MPPCPLVIALVPIQRSSRCLYFPHGVTFTEEKNALVSLPFQTRRIQARHKQHQGANLLFVQPPCGIFSFSGVVTVKEKLIGKPDNGEQKESRNMTSSMTSNLIVNIIINDDAFVHEKTERVETKLKTLDTIGNCLRPVFSLGVPQHMHTITNL